MSSITCTTSIFPRLLYVSTDVVLLRLGPLIGRPLVVLRLRLRVRHTNRLGLKIFVALRWKNYGTSSLANSLVLLSFGILIERRHPAFLVFLQEILPFLRSSSVRVRLERAVCSA